MGKKSRKGQPSRAADHVHHKSGEGNHHHHHLYLGSHTNHHHHHHQTQPQERGEALEGQPNTYEPIVLGPLREGGAREDGDALVDAANAVGTRVLPRSPHSRATEEADGRNNVKAEPPLPYHHRRQGVRYNKASHYKRKTRKAAPASLRNVVQRVSRKAALSTKKAVWDSNDISMDAAVQAVHHWENLYNALRQCTIVALQQAHHLYQATKLGASSMEQGILGPVRDWIVLPTFAGLEQGVLFLQSEHAHNAARESIKIVRCVPLLGDHVLAPGLCLVGGIAQTTWHTIQYPIPSKQQVRDTVDWALTSSKWALRAGGRELFWYFKRADANITRTLSHTQWKVLGSGPYASLDDAAKQDVLSHITDKYCSLHPLWGCNDRLGDESGPRSITSTGNDRVDHDCILARYELAAHIKRNNPHLYHDLVRSGLLLERGGTVFQDDEWLRPCPVYRYIESRNFLIPESYDDWLSEELDQDASLAGSDNNKNPCTIRPLWFRFPFVNGKAPTSRDARWICFSESDQHDLESRYRDVLLRGGAVSAQENVLGESIIDVSQLGDTTETPSTKHPTVAQWYSPDPTKDVMVDQQRHAVTFLYHCPECQKTLEKGDKEPAQCEGCRTKNPESTSSARTPYLVPPPVSGIMRPTFWRFHGPGSDIVCRSNWFLDTPRYGLQPFDDDAQAVLEDAYLFLKWMAVKKDPLAKSLSTENSHNTTFDRALLTVDVTCPDGTDRLVQFGSLTHATAIQKGLSAAMSINKLRVYRGAWLPKRSESEESEAFPIPIKPADVLVQEQIDKASSICGTLGETAMPNACLREMLTPPLQAHQSRENPIITHAASGDMDLAVPATRLCQEDMAKFLRDPKGGEVDHLCLIVHGIGEMLQSIDLFGLALPNLSTFVDCCGFLRQNHSEVQLTDVSCLADRNKGNSKSCRVEYLPVEWHEAFSILSQRRSPSVSASEGSIGATIKDISLPTIANMREFANDTLLDVLFFMSPEHHDLICEIVSDEMNVVVQKFRLLTGFCGRVSIVGHSLGSIIAWDILSNQNIGVVETEPSAEGEAVKPAPMDSTEESSKSLVLETAASETREESPERQLPARPISIVTKPICSAYPQLDFTVDNLFLLGSPVSVFLMIRNQRQPLSESFSLNGCSRVYNIFHPFDVVAYRIEPCIDPRNADFEPTIIKHWNGGFRLQYQTKKLWKRLLDTTWETQQNVAEAFEAGLSGMGLLDSVADFDAENDSNSVDTSDSLHDSYVSTGKLNLGDRIDYMLQEKEIESANEYVAALAAHSCYWTEKDLSLFIAQKLSASGDAGEEE